MSRKLISQAELSIIILFLPLYLNAIELTISQPGLYQLGSSIASNPTGADTIINIAASNVVLDLGGYIVAQANATASVDGIVVNSNLSNITIQNGTIRNVTNRGLVVNQSCSAISVNNLYLENCAIRGISFEGNVAPNQITDCQINDCRFSNCSSNASADFLLNLQNCLRITINNVLIFGTIAAANILYTSLSNCTLCTLNKVIIQGNSSPTFFGIQDSSGTGNIFNGCVVRVNNASSTNLNGFNITNCLQDRFINCQAVGNSSSLASGRGFVITTNQNLLFENCIALANRGTSTIGFLVNAVNQSTFNDCMGMANTATGTASGFQLINSSFNTLLRYIGSNQASTGSSGQGLVFNTTVSNFCMIKDGLFKSNKGTTAATSLGVSIVTGANNLFTRCIGCNNNTGATAAQLSGVPAGSVTSLAAVQSSNINSATTPWINLSVSA
ncbi:hypothetical protein HYX58_00145 [Candidatus Dependentiae bacterium]|nr:hypothetical protein [Candidatus Dependentiae bacterium]